MRGYWVARDTVNQLKIKMRKNRKLAIESIEIKSTTGIGTQKFKKYRITRKEKNPKETN
jgi:hypothetical protein